MTTTTATESDRAEWHARDATPTEALNAWTERAAKLEAENARLRRELDEPLPVTLDDAYAAIRAAVRGIVEENDRLRAENERLARKVYAIGADRDYLRGRLADESKTVAVIRAENDRLRSGGMASTTLTPERAAVLDDAAEATARMVAAIQEQAREGETPDQTVERIIRERDESRARLAFCDRTLDDVCRALGLNVDETSRGDMLRKIERLTSARAEAERLRGEGDDIEAELLEVFGEHRADDSTISKVRTLIAWHRDEVDFIGQIELLLGLDGDPGEIPDAIRKLIEERDHLRVTIQTAIPAIRAGLGAGGSLRLNDVRSRNAARDSLHALEAAVEGAEPAAVLSAAERKAVEALRRWRELPDERIGDPFAAEWLDVLEAADAMIEAGRPLAGEGKEG